MKNYSHPNRASYTSLKYVCSYYFSIIYLSALIAVKKTNTNKTKAPEDVIVYEKRRLFHRLNLDPRFLNSESPRRVERRRTISEEKVSQTRTDRAKRIYKPKETPSYLKPTKASNAKFGDTIKTDPEKLPKIKPKLSTSSEPTDRSKLKPKKKKSEDTKLPQLQNGHVKPNRTKNKPIIV